MQVNSQRWADALLGMIDGLFWDEWAQETEGFSDRASARSSSPVLLLQAPSNLNHLLLVEEEGGMSFSKG